MEEPLLPGSHGEQSSSRQRAMVACGDGCGLSDPEDLGRRKATTRKLVTAIVFCILFMIVEVWGAFLAGSLAILTDAAHLLSDVASFAISLFAIYASGWDATPKQSYGFHRMEILGALLSIHLIWLVTGILVYEAVSRFIHGSQEVKGALMFLLASLGLLVNIAMMKILGEHGHGHGHSHSHGHEGHTHGTTTTTATTTHHRHSHDDHSHHGDDHGGRSDSFLIRVDSRNDRVDHHDHHDHRDDHNHDHAAKKLKLDKDIDEIRPSSKGNINVRSAYLHVLGDLIQSIGVMIAGAIIWYKPEWKVLDLVCTLLFSVLVLFTTFNMWKEISDVLMESTPREIDATRLEEGLKKIGSVQAVHELHIWAITLGKVLLACHVKVQRDADADEVLRNVIEYCQRDFKISHVTIQIERD